MTETVRHAVRAFRRLVNAHCLHPFDVFGDSKAPIPHPPIFILGAPRCGSTLLSQVLVKTLDVGYFSNLHAQFYGAPSLVQRFKNCLPPYIPSSFQSQHGRTGGWSEPSENAEYWYRFFRRKPAYMRVDEMTVEQSQAFRRSMQKFIASCRKPVLIKNLYVALRLGILSECLPEARYIVLHRNRFDNAASILNGRLKNQGSFESWWSVEVPNVEQLLQQDAITQVLGQIDGIYALINEAEKKVHYPQNQFMHVTYEELCQDPRSFVNEILQFVPECQLRDDAFACLPDRFEAINNYRTRGGLFDELLSRISAHPT